MGIPRKVQAVQPSFVRYFLKEGGWQSLLKFAVGVTVVGYGGYSLNKFVRSQRLHASYINGIKLHETGTKGSEIGPMYYNEKRSEPDFVKCKVDTSKKLHYGENYIK
jgi:hypothetical protein